MDQIRANVVFYFDTEPGESDDDAFERLLCILDGLGIQWVGVGEPEHVHHENN